MKRLTAGECTAAPSVRETLQDLAKASDMRRALMPVTPIIRGIPLAPFTEADRTKLRADLAQAEQAHRDRQARQDVGFS